MGKGMRRRNARDQTVSDRRVASGPRRRARPVPSTLRDTVMLVAVVACMTACALGGRRSAEPVDPSERVEDDTGAVTLTVENNSTLDVRVYALRGTLPTRLGLVRGMQSMRFTLAPDLVHQDLRFLASPVGATTRLTTDALFLRGGQAVSWKLASELRSSQLSIQ